jgi:hypothetical protein
MNCSNLGLHVKILRTISLLHAIHSFMLFTRANSVHLSISIKIELNYNSKYNCTPKLHVLMKLWPMNCSKLGLNVKILCTISLFNAIYAAVATVKTHHISIKVVPSHILQLKTQPYSKITRVNEALTNELF